MASTDKAIAELSKIFEDDEVALLADTYLIMDSDNFMRSMQNIKDDQVVHVTGSGKRLDIAKRKVSLANKAPAYEIQFIDLVDLEPFYRGKLAGLNGEELPPQDIPMDEPHEKEEELQEVLEDSEESEEHAVQTLTTGEEEEVATIKPKPRQQTAAGVCQYGVPVLTVEYIPPNVVGLKESLIENVSQEDLDTFYEKVKNKVLRKVGSS